MATDETTQDAPAMSEKLTANLARMEELSARLVAALSKSGPVNPALSAPGHELYMKAATAYMAEMMANPAKLMERQISYWGKTLQHAIEAQQSLIPGIVPAAIISPRSTIAPTPPTAPSGIPVATINTSRIEPRLR